MTRDSLLQCIDRHPLRGASAALVFGGLVSLLRGVDTNWDLRNYHFYNPWAWLHGRLYWDYAPAQVQSYYSPLLDVPFFALVDAQLPAYAITFLMGLPFGLAAWFFVRIARFATIDASADRDPLALAAILLVALTGAAGLSQIGSTMNEWTTASLVLAALFVIVRAVREGSAPSAQACCVAGLLCGVATGLKLTAAIYTVALGCAFVAGFRGRNGFARAALVFAGAVLAGFALAYGYWGWVLWERFGNPFFPYFNDIFRSAHWEPVAFFDTRFRPTTLARWIAFPFGLAERNRLAGEVDLRDPRLALLCLFSVVLAVSLIRESRARGERMAAALNRAMAPGIRVLAVFAGASYVVWLAVFTIYRYTIPLELVASLLLVLAMRASFAGAARRSVLLATVSVLIVAVTVPPYWGRSRIHAGPYIDVSVPPIAADSLVMTMSGQPLAYLIPFLPSGTRAIAPASNFTNPRFDNLLQRGMAALIARHTGPMYALRYLGTTDAGEEAAMAAYGLRRADAECLPIRSNLEANRRVGLCPLHRESQGST